ncbi:STIMPY, WUSCHEL-RELATED HOMEOBOX 9, WUSCHEL related homeobox 9A, homeobox-3 [Hibiscus trionum]|uniref:STIMPY, WUSCHEL-RELATED HOMEOBOX 9, WUSCHEL related homeobox 9A, homeobox-3 n=1 Tax=Hibiscus trionum TaxID=183268 RepID=A0A9W7HT75_HIBTR|nr:STIMPY, WUSCHEL-RELATED HOMEOBOX 9, WUSCHEL related homeobox 9A, homeobox-3 [Hibiscus trionum]
MSSSNKHWPSMFKSKPCNTHHQWQHDINPSLMSTGCQKAPYSSGYEERSPEPKPRWNPKPEQIRILEAIFNSGMVNPPRDEIRKIRAQLQEYGQVGDANVFYWFQNRKSRSKHKLRNLQNSKQQSQQNQRTPPITAPSSSSSSSEKSSPKGASANNNSTLSLSSTNVVDVSNSPTASVNQAYFHHPQNEFLNEPFFFPMQQASAGAGFTHAFGFSELTNVIQVPEQPVGPCTSLLLSEILSHRDSRKEQDEKMNMQLQLSYSTVTTAPSTHSIAPHTGSTSTTTTVPSNIQHIHGVGESAAVDPGNLGRSTVFINDVAFEVTVGSFNVREAFGDDAILINSSGQPVLTNEWGLTLQSLQHGGFYYLVRSLSPFSI